MQELFKTIQSEASKKIWSKGVELSRSGSVQGDHWSEEEIKLRVKVRGKAIAPQVTLWPQDEDWSCNCSSDDDPCEHTTAAVISLKQAQLQGKKLPESTISSAVIKYYFERKNGALDFKRVLAYEGKEQALVVILTAMTSGRIKGPPIAPSKEDMTADHILDGVRHGGVLTKNKIQPLIQALEGCSEVYLDKKKITCQRKTLGSVASIEDFHGGIQISSKKSSKIKEFFTNGIVLCDNQLFAFSEAKLPSHLSQFLENKQYFGQKELVKLVSEYIPKLREFLPVEILTKNLPETTYTQAHIIWESEGFNEDLSLKPLIAYGDPVLAKVKNNELLSLSNIVPIRNFDTEEQLKNNFIKKHPDKKLEEKIHLRGENALLFLRSLKEKNEEIEGTGTKNFSEFPPLQVVLPSKENISQNHMDFEFISEENNERAQVSSSKVLQAWENGESLVQLDNHAWAQIPHNWLEKYGSKLRDLLASKNEKDEIPSCMQVLAAEFCDDLGIPTPLSLEKWQSIVKDFKKVPQFSLPNDLKANLRDYQTIGINWLAFLRDSGMGALLADDMGLGKTLQAIALIKGKTLVVAPTSVLENWSNEINKFRPQTSHQIYHGPQRKLSTNAQVILTSYAILRLDLDILNKHTYDTVILDEAQYIKNPASQAARAAYELKSDFRIALSGTPVENKLDDMWSLFNFLNRGLLGSVASFKKNWVRPIIDGDHETADNLRKRVKPFILRRMKKDVAKDLPPRTDIVLHCEFSEEEKDCYDALRLASKKEIMEKLAGGGQVFQALEILLRLRQAACHRALIPGQESATSSSKVDLLLESLIKSTENNHKSLVFSQWTSLLDLIEPELTKAGIKFLRIDGSSKNRQEIVNKFQNDADFTVLLLSLKAAGVGLNLTAADHVYMCDPWWNPAVEDQAADRAHRIGQNKAVLVTKLIAKDSVEEKILALQEKKKNLAESMMSPQNASSSLTKEDIMELLN